MRTVDKLRRENHRLVVLLADRDIEIERLRGENRDLVRALNDRDDQLLILEREAHELSLMVDGKHPSLQRHLRVVPADERPGA